MFEKIFGIFRKKKKTDVSQEITGDGGEGTFGDDTGGLEEDFDADTISLETGGSGDSGFSDSGGSDLGAPSAPALNEGLEGGLDLGEDTSGGLEGEAPSLEAEGPISPPPELETFAPSRRRRGGIKSIIAAAALVILCAAGGFFGVKPAIEVLQKAMSKGPTPAEQLAAFDEENKQLDAQLKAYRALGNIDAMIAIRDEMKKRTDLQAQTKQIESKVADQPYVENRLGAVSIQLEKTKLDLVIEKGALANVEKAVKQVEARNEYLSSTTKKNLQLIAETNSKSDIIKERLKPEDVQEAETAGSLHYSIRKELEESMSEAVPSS